MIVNTWYNSAQQQCLSKNLSIVSDKTDNNNMLEVPKVSSNKRE